MSVSVGDETRFASVDGGESIYQCNGQAIVLHSGLPAYKWLW
jgi:hypothetical protein